MTKAKKKKVVKPKSNAPKAKGETLSLSNFGDVSVDKKLKFQKDLALSLDKLFSVEETIRKEIIPTISKHFNTYINWLKKNTPIKYKELQMKDLKKYAWDLVGYKRKAGIGGGRKVANESFEANVGRACKVALLMDKGKLTINKKGIIVGVSSDISPIRFYENSNGTEKSEPNTSKDIEKARIADIEDMFNRIVLGKTTKYSSKSSKKKAGVSKDTKSKPVSFESVLKAINAKLVDINCMTPAKLADTVKGTKLSYMKSIAQEITLIVAKLKTLETNKDTAKVSTNNSLLFEADKAIKDSKVKIFGTAVLDLSKQPQARKAA